MRRVISLWFPRFQTDRMRSSTHTAAHPGADPASPFIAVEHVGGALRVSGVSAAAQEHGIDPGMTLADARALYPALTVAEADPVADLEALQGLAAWALHFTPWTALEGLDTAGGAGLWLDISGCAHLFGGEEALAETILSRLAGFGFGARAGIGDGKAAAWAAARFMDPGKTLAVIPEGAARQILPSLPVGALRLPPATLETLRRLGLRRIADLLTLPRAPLAARFGNEVATRLDQMFGHRAEPFEPLAPPAPYRVRFGLPEPIGLLDDVLAALDRLLGRLCARLARDGKGARRLLLEAFRVDGTTQTIEVGTARPVRDPEHLRRLFCETLNALEAGFGIEALVLSAAVTEPLRGDQIDLSRTLRTGRRPCEQDREFGLLVDRLGDRLGGLGVIRPTPQASHLPERAVRPGDAFSRPAPQAAWPRRPRPPHLLPRPEPVHGDGTMPPRRIRWRRHDLSLTRADGPERIAAEWWHGLPLPDPAAVRDYWRVEDTAGRRLWLFHSDGEWFVHGVLP